MPQYSVSALSDSMGAVPAAYQLDMEDAVSAEHGADVLYGAAGTVHALPENFRGNGYMHRPAVHYVAYLAICGAGVV